MTRLRDFFESEIRPKLMERLKYSNGMQIPRLDKIVLNMGVGEASQDRKIIDAAAAEMALISGQKPVITLARKSIATFKLRDGMTVGCKVTLRGDRMYEFLDRLINVALPRVRDFRGISPKSFDGRGNFALGIQEQVIFPEIDYNSIDRLRPMQIVITTTARSDREGFRLLELMGMPFASTDMSEAA